MSVYCLHHDAQQRDRDDHQIGAVGELGDHDHHQDDAGEAGAERVDGPRAVDPEPLGARASASAQFPIPVPHHARLAQGEGGEHPDDVELDQPGRRPVERVDQPTGDHREQDDAVGVGQPVPAGMQLPGQVAVLRQDRAQQRKAVVGGVGRQDQDQARSRPACRRTSRCCCRTPPRRSERSRCAARRGCSRRGIR